MFPQYTTVIANADIHGNVRGSVRSGTRKLFGIALNLSEDDKHEDCQGMFIVKCLTAERASPQGVVCPGGRIVGVKMLHAILFPYGKRCRRGQ